MISRNSATPLYEQIATEVKREIMSNLYGDCGKIGTHSQMAERFNVSLITIRKAIKLLEEEGLVTIQQGKGTFVRRSNLVDPLVNLTAITDMMRSMNVETKTLVPIFEMRDTPNTLPKDVQEALGKESLFLCRVASVNNVPYSCAEMYIPGKYAKFFTREKVTENTIYSIYEREVGMTLGIGRQIIRAAGADGKRAKYLNLPNNWPVLQIERKAYNNEGEMIQFLLLTYEAKKYSFEVELELKKGD